MSEAGMIRPGVVVDGVTIHPPGWMYVVAWAMAGVAWAVEEADKPDFKERMRAWLTEQKRANIDAQIKELEDRIAQLKAKRP